MKSLPSVLTLSVALVLALTFGVSAQTPVPLRGDVNGDGVVSALDALAVLTGVVGKEMPEGYRLMPNGDADGNGRLSAVDALLILAHSVGKTTAPYPVGTPLPTIRVVPDSVEVVEGKTVLLSATVAGTASDRVIWRSAVPRSAAVDSTGRVTGLRSAGSPVAIEAIIAGDSAIRDTAWVRVLAAAEEEPAATLSIAPSAPFLETGGALQLDAVVTRGSGTTAAHPAWSSSDTTIVSVSASGLAVGGGIGTAWIRAEQDGARDSVQATVMKAVGTLGSAGGVVDSRGDTIQLTIPGGALTAGTTITVNPATSFPAHPNLLPGMALDFGPDGTTFAHPVTLRVRYDESELPTGILESELTIYRLTAGAWVELDSTWVEPAQDVVSGLLSGFSTYAVLIRPELGVFDATPDSLLVTSGDTRQLTVETADTGSGTRSNRSVSWSSTDPSRATVSSAGLVTAVGPTGTARIVAASGAVADTVLVTIQPSALDSLAASAGNAQADTVGRALTDSLVVQALDAAGNAVPGVAVAWAVTAGGGSVDADTVITSADGIARARWTLGTTPGAQSATATAGGRTVTFAATAAVGSVARLGIVTQPSDTARAGIVLARSPVVRLEDAYGNAVARAGETVTASVAGRDSTLLGTTTAPTDSAGLAVFADLAIYGPVGTWTLVFEASGLAPDTSTSVVVGPGAPAAIEIVTQPSATAAAGTGFDPQPAVRLRDGSGNPVAAGIDVTAAIDSGTGTLSGTATVSTDGTGTATFSGLAIEDSTGLHTLAFTSGALTAVSDTIDVAADCVGPTLAVGEAYTASISDTSSLCFQGGISGTAEYVYVPVNVSDSQTLSLTTTGTGIAGVTGPPSPARIPTLAAAMSLGGQETPLEDHSLRPRSYPGRRPAMPAPSAGRLRAPDAPSLAIVSGTPAVGDLWSLNVTRGCSGAPDLRTGRVFAVSQHLIVVSDTANPAGGFTTAQYDSIAAEVDTLAYPAVTGNFGSTGDRDANSRVVAFFTRAVNELSPPASSVVVPAYFEARDLYDATDCPLSNEGEILYLQVPDPTGSVNSNVRTVSSVRGAVVRTVAHELQHLVNASPRVIAGASLEEGWLDEGLSHVAEELVFYRASFGLAPGGNIALSDLTSGTSASRRVAAFNTYQNPNFGMLRSWLQRPDTTGAFRPDASPTLAQQGATWAFLRYAADRAAPGSDQSAFWSSLVNPTATGKTNLQNAIGSVPNEWLRDFAAAMYADDAVTGIGAAYTQPSWHFRSVYGGLGGVPLGTRALSDGTPLTLSYSRGGSGSFVRFGVAMGTTATVTTSGASIPSGAVELIVVRTK